MFDKGYDYRKVQVDKSKGEGVFLTKHIFVFISSSNHRKYIVEVEEYKYNMFILKFHLKCHNKADDKYSRMTKFNDVTKVLRTCIDIMIQMYKDNPYSSFGFMGANMVDEEIPANKRFRVYSVIMNRFFSPKRFWHNQNWNKNLYFLINKDSSESNLEQKIIDSLSEIYDF
jgi:hypothetical protein